MKTILTTSVLSILLLSGCSTPRVAGPRQAQIEAACPALAKVPHKTMADVLVAYAEVLGLYHECRTAALGADGT